MGIITDIQPKLELVYDRTGILVMLKRHDCPGQNQGASGVGHSFCGCDHNHDLFNITGVPYILQPDDMPVCLTGCKIKHD